MNADPLDVVRDALLAAGCDPKGGQRITAKCPAHDDSNPSLSVARGTQQPVVFRCHAGCDPDAVLRALRLDWADLLEDENTTNGYTPAKEIVATYTYTDETGTPLFEVVRFAPKDFRQRLPNGTWGVGNVRRVPFRLPAVVRAAQAGTTIYVCEGEKDVLAIERAGAVATTNPGGAGKWRDEYDPFFVGANVIVVADDDEPGHRHAADVARHLRQVANATLVVVPVEGSKDVADHLGRGRTLDDLQLFQPEHINHDTPNPGDADEPWEEPIPIGYGGKVPVFPVQRLPLWLQDYVMAMSRALQVPIDLPAMMVLSVLAAAAGGRCIVEIRQGWREPLNLYTAVAMASGTRKTPVFQRIIKPLELAEREAVDKALPEVAEAKARHKAARAKADKAMDDIARAKTEAEEEAVHYASQMALLAEAIVVPSIPRILADDATPEALASLMCEQDGRLAMFSDEGEVFSMMSGRYSTSGPNLAIYLKSHVGSPVRVDRKGRDPEYIEHPALTLGLTIQPSMLAGIAGIDGARGRGLLGRFLWSIPQTNVGERDTEVEPIADEIEETYIDEMQILVRSLADWKDPAVLVFTPEADRALLAFQKELEPRLRASGGDLGHMADWASKLVGTVARIAGLLHLADNVRSGWQRPVQLGMVADAIRIGRHLIEHAKVAYEAMMMGPVVNDAEVLLRWMEGRSSFTQREAYRSNTYRWPHAADVVAPLQLLEDHDYIRRIDPPATAKRGRPRSQRFAVNPLAQK